MKTVRLFLVLCSALMACNGENPIPPGLWDQPLVIPRLGPAARSSCPEPINSREQARELLVIASGQCLDRTVEAIVKRWPDDLPAAYLVRAERHRTPVDLLRALGTAKGFNRALALQRLGLRTDAIAAWNAVVSERSEWSDEARRNRDALMRDPMEEWRTLHATPRKLAQTFPFESAREMLDSGMSDPAAARIVANVLVENRDPYLQDVLNAMERPGNGNAMRAYRAACTSKAVADFERAALLLERAGNPLHLYARYRVVRIRFLKDDVVPLLDALIPITDRRYRLLSYALHTLRANALEQRGSYFTALPEYEEALRFQQSDTQRAAILSRRSLNYETIGSVESAFRDAIDVVDLLPRISDLNTHSTVYASAAKAATKLDYPEIALLYRNALVETAQKAVLSRHQTGVAEHVLAVAFRARAETHTALNDISAARVDLGRARDLAEALNDPVLGQYLRMRLREVEGDTLLPTDATEAAQAFREAITLAQGQYPTYRAALLFKLAEARREIGDPRADDAVDAAFAILRNEATQLLDATARGDYENFWGAYFSRFRDMHRAAIQRRIDRGQVTEAFLQDEQARAFELLHTLQQARSRPPDFRPVARDNLDQHLTDLPADTVLLQYLVLRDRTYVWVLRQGEKPKAFRLPATEKQIQTWYDNALAVKRTGQADSLTDAMRAVYAALFRTPLAEIEGGKHLVIIPDGPMHGLPFAALEGATEGYLLARVKSIATDGSTSRYLYARKRDAQFSQDGAPSVLLAAATVFDQAIPLRKLPKAQEEVNELQRWYPQAQVLRGADVTEQRFLAGARGATIVHFAGHAIPFPRSPWESQLLLASGELTAEKLMRELSELERTRLVVLGACSTAGGQPVGPEGLAPLVRPLIAANVPAVVGTLWDVGDATAKELLVSLHCHYRHGDDVAVALRAAQLEMLRNDHPAMSWAPYQVVGYAGSPYPSDPAMEKTPHESVCAQHSLQRPDGLHPQ